MIDEIALFFLISLAYGIFFLTITSVANILRFSKSFGKSIGFGYLIFTFIWDLLTGSPEYADFANLSISHYLNPAQILFQGLTNENFWDIWTPFLVIIGISAIFVFIGLWRVKYPDFIERVKPLNEKGSKSGFNPLAKIFLKLPISGICFKCSPKPLYPS